MADAATTAEAAEKTWNELLQAYSKAAPALGAAAPFLGGTLPFPFPQPMFPFNLAMFGGVPGFNPAFAMGPAGPDGAAVEAKSHGSDIIVKAEPTVSGEDDDGDDEEDDGEGPSTLKRVATRAASVPANGKKARGDGMGVKSNSSAALAMLAGAAAGNTGGDGDAGGAAALGSTPVAPPAVDTWAGLALPGSAPAELASGGGSRSEQGRLTVEQAALMGVTDERELKRLRRKQSNRESARRSRLRKQAECEALARQVKDLISENSKLKEEKLQLLAQIEILNAKLSMSTFGAVHALGQGELEKIQAELRKQTEAQQASMAAALAQVNATLAAAGADAPAAVAAATNGIMANGNGKTDLDSELDSDD